MKTSSDAVFGQFGVRPTDTIRLTGGMRYTWDKKDRIGSSQLRCDIAGRPGVGDGRIRQSKPTYLLGIDWSPTSRNLV